MNSTVPTTPAYNILLPFLLLNIPKSNMDSFVAAYSQLMCDGTDKLLNICQKIHPCPVL